MDEIVNEPSVEYKKRKYSVHEYLEMENASQEKHEYFEGEIFPLHREVSATGITSMYGAALNHNYIFSNTFGFLSHKLYGSKCIPFGSDMRMNISENTLFTILTYLFTAMKLNASKKMKIRYSYQTLS